jgi:uncharacterized protein (TIGR02996 family)
MQYPEHPGLLAGVIADAEEDAPRLVYADWLDEHGDPDRAAFIRLGCALADKSPADPDYVDLTERRVELLAAMRGRRLGPKLPASVGFDDNISEEREGRANYHRGFPYFVCEPHFEDGLPLTDELNHALAFRDALPQVLETTTLRGLRFCGPFSRHLGAILSSPAAGRLSALSVFNYPESGTVEAIASSPAAGSLEWLDLSFLDADDTDALCGADGFARLKRLDVSGMVGFSRAALRRLLAADWLGGLRRIEIEDVAEDASYTVAGLVRLPHLHTLEIHALAPEGLTVLSKAGGAPALGGLSLFGTRLQGAGASALGRARMPRLLLLRLIDCDLRNDDLAALSRLFANLRVLDLKNNKIGARGVAAIAAGPCAAALRVLRLGDNRFGKQALRKIAKGAAFPRLTTLDLNSPPGRTASAEEVTRFLTELDLPRLRHLDLRGWPVDDRGAKALAHNPAFAGLTCLSLSSCRVGATGARALIASPHLQRLLMLDLSFNPASSNLGKAAEALCDPALLPDLRECRLHAHIPEKVKKRLEAARGPIFL